MAVFKGLSNYIISFHYVETAANNEDLDCAQALIHLSNLQ